MHQPQNKVVMQPSLLLVIVACASHVFAKPRVYNTTLRESLFHNRSAEITKAADATYDELQNKTLLSTARSTLTDVPTAYRHHNPTLNETALLNSSYGRAQFETAFNTFADIQYVHNSSWVGALNSPAVKNFSSSLSKGDREAFHHLLVEQREMTKSEFEAFSRYPTTRAWLRCASSSPRGNFTAFTLCRSDTSSYSPDQDLIASDDAKRRGAVRLAQTCFKLAVEFSMTSMGIHVATIIAAALKASIAVFRLFAIGFLALMAAWTSAGCVAYSAIAVYRLDHI